MTPSPAGLNGVAYQTLFKHSLDAVFFTAPDGRIFAANNAAELKLRQLSKRARGHACTHISCCRFLPESAPKKHVRSPGTGCI